MKKTLVSISIALLLLVLATGAVFAASTGRKHMAIEGSWNATENDQVDFPTIYVQGSGSGSATNLGDYTVHYDAIVYNDPNGVGTAVAIAHFTTSNGDILFAEGKGLGVSTNTPGVNQIEEDYDIVGGTGGFARAKGNITVKRLVTLATGASTGSMEGTITLR